MRNVTFDIMKGLGIICMILGHIPVGGITQQVIYSFHMPMFFFISGYFFSRKNTFLEFITGKFKTILLPALFTIGILLLYRVLTYLLNGTELVLFSHIIGPLWFLFALFWGVTILYFITKLKSAKVRLAVSLLVSIIGLLFSHYYLETHINILQGMVAVPFLIIGYELRHLSNNKNIRSFTSDNFYKLLVVSFITWGLGIFFSHLDMKINNFGCFVFDIISSFMGCLFIYQISKKMQTNNFIAKSLSYIGRYSIVFLCMHYLEWYSDWNKNIQNIEYQQITPPLYIALQCFRGIITLVLSVFIINTPIGRIFYSIKKK